MNVFSLHQFLVLFAWFPLAALLLLMLLIGRFYQKFSGERTYYRLYVIPLVLFGAGSVRSAGISPNTPDMLVNILSFLAGAVLLVLAVRLYQRMLSQNKQQND